MHFPLNVLVAAVAMSAAACAPRAASVLPLPVAPPPTAVAATLSDSTMVRQRAADSVFRNDYANFSRYRVANAQLAAPAPGERRVVFMGNSITEGWVRHFPTMFAGKPYIGRGIGGQTTPQMLVRFHADVVALKPAVVVILGGTNDIAGNTGPSTLEMIEDNLMAMTEVAQANGIRVVLSSVLPVFDYPWKRGLTPAPKIVALNTWMKSYAARVGAVYLDYHTAMRDDRDGLRAELGDDGVHPNEAGYRIMAGLVESAIADALSRK
jgi:lysophospholipase L1-like esterase